MDPKQQKKLITGLAIAGGLYMLYKIYTADNGGTPWDPTGNTSPNPHVGSNFNAAKVANDLYEAMRYSGTDEEAIMQTLRYVTQDQFAKVVVAFGEKQYNRTLGNQINPTAWFTELPFVGLAGWLKNELSNSEYHTLKLKYPKYL